MHQEKGEDVKTYTEQELLKIGEAFYRRGFEDGRLPRDRMPEPEVPTLADLGLRHPRTASDDPANMAHKRPWLDKVPPTK